MTTPIDTLEYAASLEAAGVPKTQADAHARALAQALKEVHLLPRAIDEQTQRLGQAEARLNHRLDQIESRLTVLEHTVAEMHQQQLKFQARTDKRLGELGKDHVQLEKEVAKLEKEVAKLAVMMKILLAVLVPTCVSVVARWFV
ncbi:MAG: hypothetical protein V4463_16620 [Pseudomonadota bacterium]